MATAKEAKSKSLYDVHPGVAMVQKWIAEMKQKTGRSLEEWIALAKKEGPKEEKARREWLRAKHKLGTNSAGGFPSVSKGRARRSPEAYLKTAAVYVEEQYAERRINCGRSMRSCCGWASQWQT